MSSHPPSIGKYKVLGVLGKGAMGLVYRGEDPLLGRQVAIKVISGDDVTDEMKERFRVEARAAAALDHPNIVVIYELGEEAGKLYIVMELLVGEDLRALTRRRPNLPVTEACEIIAQVCEGLAYAHDRKIIHRDIKPANIHICPDGRVKIVDFGVAKMESTSLTQTGMVIGTPDYMSPEQIQGKAIDTRSDIFSVGVVLYELLAGNKPFSSESITSVIYNIVFKEPESFAALSREVPAEVERIVHKAMAKDLDDRYQRIGEMAADLRRHLAGRVREETLAAPASDEATRILTPQELPTSRSGTLAPGTVRVAESPEQRQAAAGIGGGTQVLGGVSPGDAGAARSGKGRWIAIAAAAVVIVGAGVAWLLMQRPEAVAIEVVVVPWAEVQELTTAPDGKPVDLPATRTTPLQLALPPGTYRAKLHNPVLNLSGETEFTVAENASGPVRLEPIVLGGFDAEAAWEDLLR